MTRPPLHVGVEVLAKNPAYLKGKRVGLVTNDAATTAFYPQRLMPTREALIRAGVPLKILFSPEHGLFTVGADGVAMLHSTDVLTGLTIYSLYGDNLRPTQQALSNLDVVLFDLPDVGCRFYTYIWTLTHVMEACATANIPLIVLDRPNPIGGLLNQSEGPMLDELNLSSFIGRWSIPIRHSLTVGELALFWKNEKSISIDLQVIKVENWRREQYFEDLNLPFVPPSPAMVSPETALVYPGMGLLEGTNLSEGRGTPFPFRMFGSPWLSSHTFAGILNEHLTGCVARAVSFTPFGKYANQLCHGIMLHITDPHAFRPVATGLVIICLLKHHYPNDFQWDVYPTHVNPSGEAHFDKLVGQRNVRHQIEANSLNFLKEIPQLTQVLDWPERVKSYLLY